MGGDWRGNIVYTQWHVLARFVVGVMLEVAWEVDSRLIWNTFKGMSVAVGAGPGSLIHTILCLVLCVGGDGRLGGGIFEVASFFNVLVQVDNEIYLCVEEWGKLMGFGKICFSL